MKNEEEAGARGHEAKINESWSEAKRALKLAQEHYVDPDRAIWEQPTHSAPKKQRAHIAAHNNVIEFRDEIRPKRNDRSNIDVSDQWQNVLDVITVGGERIEISLDTLEEIEYKKIEQTTSTTSPIRGRQTETTTYRVLMPLRTCRLVYRQLLDVVDELGLGFEEDNPTPEDEARPEHLVGLLKNRGDDEAVGQLPARFRNAAEDAEDNGTELPE